MSIQPGGILQPGAPLYEALKAAFAAMAPGEPPAVPPCHPFANIFPMLAADDRRLSFRTSLAEKQNHPVILHRGMLLDGRNRARELIELNLPISFAVFDGGDRQALDFACAENYERRDLTDKQRAMCAARIATLRVGDNQHTRKPTPIGAPTFDLGEGAQPEPEAAPMRSIGEASAMMHAPRRSVERAAVIEAKGAPELKAAVETGPISLAAGADIAKLPLEEQRKIVAAADPKVFQKVAKERRAEDQAAKKQKRQERERKLAANNRGLPDIQAGVIVADPQWGRTVYSDETGMDRHAANHYPTEKGTEEAQDDKIKALPVGSIAAPHSVCGLWCTEPWRGEAVLRAWGFEPKAYFVWVKDIVVDEPAENGMLRSGQKLEVVGAAGMGFWNRDRAEIMLIGVKGHPAAPAPGTQGERVWFARRGEHAEEREDVHSDKPDCALEWFEKHWPTAVKVELNARRSRPGWIPWGNEAPEPEQQQLGIEPAEEAAA